MPRHTVSPVESEHSPTSLREGFTTGSAVSAAAIAAVTLLLSGRRLAEVSVQLPPFNLADGILQPLSCKKLTVPITEARACGENMAMAQVVKDGGDDPDATHGLLLEVYASLASNDFGNAVDGAGDYPGVWLQLSRGVRIKSGPGVGLATLPGLPVAPGEPAINPEPRKQIAFAAREAALQHGFDGPLFLYLRVPRGAEKAAHTLNSRLGISGGISILGTRGTVRPYSHDAWQATISQSLDIARALGYRQAAFSTGRRSEQGLQALFPELAEQCFVQAADFAAFSVRAAVERGFERIIWGCYSGKLLKLAQGLEYTHARSAPADLPLLARLAGENGVPAELRRQLEELPTAQGAFDLLTEKAPAACAATLKSVAKTALSTLTAWAKEAKKPPRITLCVFKTDNAPWLVLPPGSTAE